MAAVYKLHWVLLIFQNTNDGCNGISLRNALHCQNLFWKCSKWLGHIKYSPRLNLFFKMCISSKKVLLIKQKLFESINKWITEWHSKAYSCQEFNFRASYQSSSALNLLFVHELYEYGFFQFLLNDTTMYLIEDNTHSVSNTEIRLLTGGG